MRAFNLGAATGIDINAGNGWIVRPELRVAWSRFLTDPSPPVPAFLRDTPIVLRDPDPGRDGAVVALELTGATAGLQLFAGYAGEFPPTPPPIRDAWGCASPGRRRTLHLPRTQDLRRNLGRSLRVLSSESDAASS